MGGRWREEGRGEGNGGRRGQGERGMEEGWQEGWRQEGREWREGNGWRGGRGMEAGEAGGGERGGWGEGGEGRKKEERGGGRGWKSKLPCVTSNTEVPEQLIVVFIFSTPISEIFLIMCTCVNVYCYCILKKKNDKMNTRPTNITENMMNKERQVTNCTRTHAIITKQKNKIKYKHK